jgi:hypothetical protein
VGDSLLVLLNAASSAVPFVLPAHRAGTRWIAVFDTARNGAPRAVNQLERGGRPYDLQPHSVAVFRLAVAGDRRTERA